MLKLSGKTLIQRDSSPIDKKLKILYVNKDREYKIICNEKKYNLKKDSDYLIWDLPKNINKNNLKIKVQAYDEQNKILYTTNELLLNNSALEIEPMSLYAMNLLSAYNLPIDTSQFDPDYTIYNMLDEHKIIPVVNRKINMPANYQIVVSRDNVSQLLTFEINRFFDGIDLSEKACGIKYINAKREEGRAIPINFSKTDKKLIFGWLLDDHAAAKAGITRFSIEFLGMDEHNRTYVWQTVPADLIVEEGIWINDSVVTERYPTIIEDILIRLRLLENGGDNTELERLLEQAATDLSLENDMTLIAKNIFGTEISRVDLPAGSVSEFAFLYFDDTNEFPNLGNEKRLYIVITTGKEAIYRWDGTELKYYKISNNFENINDDVIESITERVVEEIIENINIINGGNADN